MDIMEIILLAVGGIIFVLSFFIPDRKGAGSSDTKALAEDEIKSLVNQELESIRSHVDDVVEEAVSYAIEKTERSMERLSNEKIMAVSEYSDTVLAEIHKNHEEAVFLYDMLNNKHINLKNTVSEINRTVKEAEETVTTFQKLAPETLVPQAADGTQVEPPVVEIQPNKGTGKNQSKRNSSKRNSSKKASSNKTSPKGISAGQAPGKSNTQNNIYEETSSLNGAEANQQSDGQEDQKQQEYNNNDKILGLYQQGKSAVEIAKELELGVGEVTLVIDLFKS